MNTGNLNNFNEKFTIARNRTAGTFSNLSNTSRFNFQGNYFNLPRNIRRNHVFYAFVVVALVASFLLGRTLSSDSALNLSSDNRTQAPKPLATQNLNKEWFFSEISEILDPIAKYEDKKFDLKYCDES